MTEDTRQRFQGLCLESTEGRKHMPIFDEFPPSVRDRLRNSRFNLCAACIKQRVLICAIAPNTDNYMQAIDWMEKNI